MKVANLNYIDDLESKVMSKQWLEYMEIYMKHITTSPSNSLVLNELNNYLSTQSFLGGNSISNADHVAFNLLSRLMGQMSFQEKEKLINLSRWYSTLQNENKRNDKIKFSRTTLYC